MTLGLNGYRLEKPRIADSNQLGTSSPDSHVEVLPYSSAWLARLPPAAADVERRMEIMVRAAQNWTEEADGHYFRLAQFETAVNEGSTTQYNQFGFDAAKRRWDLLPGSAPVVAGVVGAGTARLRPVPDSTLGTATAWRPAVLPRVSLGEVSEGSGGSSRAVVYTGIPGPTEVLCDVATGDLTFNSADALTHLNKPVYYQRQRFYAFEESVASLGVISNSPRLALSPIPLAGAVPQIRVGFRERYLDPVYWATEVGMMPPAAGSVAWAGDTGALLFSASDLSTCAGEAVYYDGCLSETALSCPTVGVGTLGTPGAVPQCPLGTEIVFWAIVDGVFHTFAATEAKDFAVVADMDPVDLARGLSTADRVPLDTVQWARYASALDFTFSGQVRVSSADVFKYGGTTDLFATLCQLSDIYPGWSILLHRNPLDPTSSGVAQSGSVYYDVRVRTQTTDAVLVEGLGLGDRVMLPSAPVQGTATEFRVEQLGGSWTGVLPDYRSSTIPPAYQGLVSVLDYPNRSLYFGYRKQRTLSVPSEYTYKLPDTMLVAGSESLVLDGTPLVDGAGVLLDLTGGMLSFIRVFGSLFTSGTAGSVATLSQFSDTSADFSGLVPDSGTRLVVLSGPAPTCFVTTAVASPTVITVEAVGERGTPLPALPSPLLYEVRENFSLLVDNNFDEVTLTQPKIQLQKETGLLVEPLVEGVDFRFSAELSSVMLEEPLLNGQKLRATYSAANTDGTPGSIYTECLPVRVLETITAGGYSSVDHTLSFNTTNRTLIPVPVQFDVGGRPVRDSKFEVLWSTSEIRVTDVTAQHYKHPNEDDLVGKDSNLVYYVEEAAGGEVSFTFQHTPVWQPPLIVSKGDTTITGEGDLTSEIRAGCVLRVGQELALVETSTYSSAAGTTLIQLGAPLQATQRNPSVWVSHYSVNFGTVLPTYDPVAAGSLVVRFTTDLTGVLKSGSLVKFGTEVRQVASVEYTGSRTVTRLTGRLMSAPTLAAYASVTPIHELGVQSLVLAAPAVLGKTYRLWRRRPPVPAQELISGVDYRLGDSSVTLLGGGLESGDTIELEYTGRERQSGILDSTYVHYVAPSTENGLLHQRLVGSMVFKTPDTYFTRIEPIVTLVQEYSADLNAELAAKLPSSGPVQSMVGTLPNYLQGRTSLIWERGRLVDHDFISNRVISTDTTIIEALEGFTRWLSGVVPGEPGYDNYAAPTQRWDGRFRFHLQESVAPDLQRDPNVGHGWVHPYDPFDVPEYTDSDNCDRLNDLDDRVLVKQAPYRWRLVNPPDYTRVQVGTYRHMWESHQHSRIFPTERSVFMRSYDPDTATGPVANLPEPQSVEAVRVLGWVGSGLTLIDVPATLYDVGLSPEKDYLHEAPTFQIRSPICQVTEVLGSNLYQLDNRSLGDHRMVPLPEWTMVPEMARGSLFHTFFSGSVAVYRPGVGVVGTGLSPVYLSHTADSTQAFIVAGFSIMVGDTLYWQPTSRMLYMDKWGYGSDRGAMTLNDVAAGLDWLTPFGIVPPQLPPPTGEPREIEGKITMSVGRSEALRFPGLFGLPYNDDWDQTPPQLSPLGSVEHQYLLSETLCLGQLQASTVRGFGGVDGSFPDATHFECAAPIQEADGEDFLDPACSVQFLDRLVITGGSSNIGSYLVTDVPTGTQLRVATLAWQNLGPETYVATIHHSASAVVGLNIIEDSAVDFTVLLGALPVLSEFEVEIITGSAPGNYAVGLVIDATHIQLVAGLLPAGVVTYCIRHTGLCDVAPDLNYVTRSAGNSVDLSNVSALYLAYGYLFEIITGLVPTRNDGSYQPSMSAPSWVQLAAVDVTLTPGADWYVKRGSAVLTGSRGEISVTPNRFRSEAGSGVGDLIAVNEVMLIGVRPLDSLVGHYIEITTGVGDAYGVITVDSTVSVTVDWLVYGLSVDPPPDIPCNWSAYWDLSKYPTARPVCVGDVLVLLDPQQADFDRYIVSGFSSEYLIVLRESSVIANPLTVDGFHSVPGGVAGLTFRIDNCRRCELVTPNSSFIDLYRRAVLAHDTVYDDASVVSAIGYSFGNHVSNSTVLRDAVCAQPLGGTYAADISITPQQVTLTTTLDLSVRSGDVLEIVTSTSGINKGFYAVAGGSLGSLGYTVTIDSAAGPGFYQSNPVIAKRPLFKLAETGTARLFRKPSNLSSFFCMLVGQEYLHADRMHQSNLDYAVYAMNGAPGWVWGGDVSNTLLALRAGPDGATQWITNLADRAERVCPVALTVGSLQNDIWSVLWLVDCLYEQRYAWIVNRTHRLSGTLPQLKRFDAERQRREKDLLDALLKKTGLGG